MLRGIAALLVVLFHALMYCRKYVGTTSMHEFYEFESLGAVGVDIFFIVSGFIMVYVSYEKFGVKKASIDYLIRRVIRIAPVYWMWTLFYVSLLLLAPSLFNENQFSITHTIKSLLFIPSENEFTGSTTPVLGPGWSLNFEMFFYYIFALFLLFPRNYLIPGLFFLFIGLSAVGYYFQPENMALQVYTNTLLIEFLFGCFIGFLYKANVKFNLFTCYFFIVVGLAWLKSSVFYGTPDYLDENRFITWGIGAAFFVTGFAFLEKIYTLKSKLLLAIGESSYSIYLTHIFVLPIIAKIWASIHLNNYLAEEVFVFTASVLSVIFGHLAYKVTEKPVTNFLNTNYRQLKLSKTLNNRAQSGL
ncbi:MAG: acyltransferase [Cyclobacteriaceae bacterium]|nr:acyltransferase [Cyclobacteriaceae bacterium]